MRPLGFILPFAPWDLFPRASRRLPLQVKHQAPQLPAEACLRGRAGGRCPLSVADTALPHSGAWGFGVWISGAGALGQQDKTTASQALASDQFIVLVWSYVHTTPSKTPVTGPAPRAPNRCFSHHQLLTQEARNQRNGRPC